MMVGYRYFTTAGVKPAYPFGYGLSYTSFEYSDLICNRNQDGSIGISFNVTNTGAVAGKEVAQIYVHKPEIHGTRPARELCAFHKTSELAPGETENVSISLTSEDLKQWNAAEGCWAYPGQGYEFHAGASSEDIRLSSTL